jgi:flagellar hook-associated protein 3 FlgL
MERISTSSAYGSVLTNLMAAEVAQTTAGSQLSSNEAATDLKGYASKAETLAAMQATNTQVTGFLNETQTVSAKLSLQDSALNEVAGSAGSAIQAITNSLAIGDGTTIMQSLQDAFSSAIEGLNTTYNGEYLFAGGQVNTQPVTATNLNGLTAGPPISSLFHNDQRQITSKVNSNTTINSGFLADQVGTPLFNAFQAIVAYNQGPNGPFTGTLTTAQKAFLTQQIATFTSVQTGLTNVAGQNGINQNVVTSAQTDLTNRQTMLTNLMGNITQADVAKATTDLQQAQLAVQAAGQVFVSLKQTSLLNSLTSGA